MKPYLTVHLQAFAAADAYVDATGATLPKVNLRECVLHAREATKTEDVLEVVSLPGFMLLVVTTRMSRSI